MNITRRALLGTGVALAAGFMAPGLARAAKPSVTVYKTLTCSCCTLWVDHLTRSGFPVKSENHVDLAPIKKKLGVPAAVSSCHTAVVQGYVVEGHVPADVIDRLLAERPTVVGIGVPGMPIGAPGMEAPGGRAEPFQVLSFDRDGRTQVFATR